LLVVDTDRPAENYQQVATRDLGQGKARLGGNDAFDLKASFDERCRERSEIFKGNVAEDNGAACGYLHANSVCGLVLKIPGPECGTWDFQFREDALIHKIHLRGDGDNAALVAEVKQLADCRAAILAIVEGALIHIHADKAIG